VGIALDKNKNAYVAGKGTNNVVILSPDGINCTQILQAIKQKDLDMKLKSDMVIFSF
jgi:hypothetical protein